MKQLVYYSMVLHDGASADKAVTQFMHSVESLRRYNAGIPVKLVVTGAALKAHVCARLDALSIGVVRTRSYEEEIRAYLSAEWAKALSLFPLVHKWLNLRYVMDQAFDQVLYIDNDTYFARDVAQMMARSCTADIYAREEPNTRKSWMPYDPTYIDEDALRELTRREKVAFITPFNCGVVLLRRRAAEWLAAHLDVFLRYLVRFTRWMCAHPHEDEQRFILAARQAGLHTRAPKLKPLPYLGRNRWIVEERALWLTLGNGPFTMKCFSPGRLLQGNEFYAVETPAQLPYLFHYFGSNTKQFAEWLAQSAPVLQI